MKLLFENWRQYLNEELEEDMLKMSIHDFDQTQKGWRSIEDPEGQSEIMKKYIESRPEAEHDQVLMWHLAQALAFAGKVDEALEYMQMVNKTEALEYNKIYQKFTIFFLEEDMIKFNELYETHREQIEPEEKDTNTLIVKCMKLCGDAQNFSYKDAYTTRCNC
jgi:hypothetical protein